MWSPCRSFHPSPNGKWLVTSPSNSPENPPKAAGYKHFFDEVTAMFYFVRTHDYRNYNL